jgi:WhiB family transcriptional regulator, redox-sensing transcriptional regulator
MIDRVAAMSVPETWNELVYTDLAWMVDAECKGQSHLFYPPLRERPDSRLRREAAACAICQMCSSRAVCREYGRTNHEYGVWGGENEEDRVAAGYRLNAPVGVPRPPRNSDARSLNS